MNISKISRSIVVVFFVVCIVFLGFLDITNVFLKNVNTDNILIPIFVKVGFAIVVLALVLIYMYIKDKLYKLHVKRKNSFIYRYVYIILALLVTSVASSYNVLKDFSDNMILLHIIMTIVICFIIKRIIFNVSKSDILSVLGMFTYSLLPNIMYSKTAYIYSTVMIAFVLTVILVLQFLIDELKQKGIKTKKYMVQAVVLGVIMGISSSFGVNIFVWIGLLISLLFITYNLDNTHISFPKKILASLTQEKRESLYKIERININKVIVSILISLVSLLLIKFLIDHVILNMSNNVMIESIIGLKNSKIGMFNLNINSFVSNFIENGKMLVSYSSWFYICIFTYIILMEVLAIILKRRYDTKSTIMKVIFLLIYISITFNNINIYYFQPLFTVLLVLIAIVNTSNIYLNREERVKMLVA